MWYWAWRIESNNFFVHSESGGMWGQLNMQHTWTASIMQNIIGPLQVPLFLVFGVILRSIDDPTQAKRVWRLFWFYLAGTAAMSALANQFTTIATIMIFAVASLNLSRPKLVTIKAYVLILLAAVLLYGVEFSVRAVSSNLGGFNKGNQLSESITALGANSAHSNAKLKKEVFDRAFNQVNLLSQIMDRLDNGYSYLHGSALWSLLYGLVPRAVWPNKPVVTPMQLLIRGSYGLPLKDDATGPLLEAYVNGGWLLVVPVFIGIGCFCGLLTKWAARKTSLASVLIICYWWQTTGYMEQELLLTFVAAIRTVAVIAFFLWLYRMLKRTYQYIVVEMPPVALPPAGTNAHPKKV